MYVLINIEPIHCWSGIRFWHLKAYVTSCRIWFISLVSVLGMAILLSLNIRLLTMVSSSLRLQNGFNSGFNWFCDFYAAWLATLCSVLSFNISTSSCFNLSMLMGILDLTVWTWQFTSVSDISGLCSLSCPLLKVSEQVRSLPGTEYSTKSYFCRNIINRWTLGGVLCIRVFRILFKSLQSLSMVYFLPCRYSLNFKQAKTIANVALSKGQ